MTKEVDLQNLIGKRVRIVAKREYGSARMLNGLTGRVVAPHPLVAGWVKIRLDLNPVTQELYWSIAVDRLQVLG